MAAKMHITTVNIEYLTHDDGHWCNTCMLGTGLRFWVAVSRGNQMRLQQRLWCYEHEGSRGVVLDEDTTAP